MLYFNTVNMTESSFYKLTLSNKPNLVLYSSKTSKTSEKSYKYSPYKNEVLLFNISKSYNPIVEITGIFGETKETISKLG